METQKNQNSGAEKVVEIIEIKEVVSEKKEPKITMPVAIIIAGILIAGAIIMPKFGGKVAYDDGQGSKIDVNSKVEVYKIVATDLDKNLGHVIGDPNAKVKVVVYSDLECPFCKRFHETMHQVVDHYDGKVAWEYRHYPLSIHPKAQKEAEGTLCAEELGGNIAFWKYTDLIFTITPANNKLPPELLPEIAKKIGLNKKDFQTCLGSGRYAQAVKDQANEWAPKGYGTPSGYILKPDGTMQEFEGAYPAENMYKILDPILNGTDISTKTK